MTAELTVEITALGNGVGGVARREGRKTVFVRGALPGEKIICSPSKEKKNLIYAELTEVLAPSRHRIEPFCGYYSMCGGCSLQHLDYSRQLHWKKQWLSRALGRMELDTSCVAGDTAASRKTKAYRNRVSFDVTGGRPGLHRYRGDTFPVKNCPLLNSTASRGMKLINDSDLAGCARVSVRGSDRTGMWMLEFFGRPTSGTPRSGEKGTVAVREKGRWHTEPKDPRYTQTACGFRYDVEPGTFFQVNADGADIVIDKILQLTEGAGRVLDLYGGCGTFALPIAARGAYVRSVELNSRSSEAGSRAAAEYGLQTIDFSAGRVRHRLLETVRNGEAWDAVVLDPPRGGLGVRVARLLRRVQTDIVVYVSCNPFSLARDLSILVKGGWTVAGAWPVDMFPQTDHLETVAYLTRKEGK